MAKNGPAIRWLFKAGSVLFIRLAVVEQSDPAGRSLTPSELFFYQGANREQILLERAKKKGKLSSFQERSAGVVNGGLSSPKDDVDSLVPQKFKKTDLEAKYLWMNTKKSDRVGRSHSTAFQKR